MNDKEILETIQDRKDLREIAQWVRNQSETDFEHNERNGLKPHHDDYRDPEPKQFVDNKLHQGSSVEVWEDSLSELSRNPTVPGVIYNCERALQSAIDLLENDPVAYAELHGLVTLRGMSGTPAGEVISEASRDEPTQSGEEQDSWIPPEAIYEAYMEGNIELPESGEIHQSEIVDTQYSDIVFEAFQQTTDFSIVERGDGSRFIQVFVELDEDGNPTLSRISNTDTDLTSGVL